MSIRLESFLNSPCGNIQEFGMEVLLALVPVRRVGLFIFLSLICLHDGRRHAQTEIAKNR
jgi:hypothetical protein